MSTTPALFDDPYADQGPGAVASACRHTLASLSDAGLLEARHAASAALVLALADSIDQLTRYGGTRKGTPLALLARELREALAALPEPVAEVDGAWLELEAALRVAAGRDRDA